MKIYEVCNIHFNGRIKSGDLNKSLKSGYNKLKSSMEKLDAKSENMIDKIFENPDNPTFKDHLKITSTASSTSTGCLASSGAITTTKADLWSVYSSIFPSSF